jgi:hypothetical protein
VGTARQDPFTERDRASLYARNTQPEMNREMWKPKVLTCLFGKLSTCVLAFPCSQNGIILGSPRSNDFDSVSLAASTVVNTFVEMPSLEVEAGPVLLSAPKVSSAAKKFQHIHADGMV